MRTYSLIYNLYKKKFIKIYMKLKKKKKIK